MSIDVEIIDDQTAIPLNHDIHSLIETCVQKAADFEQIAKGEVAVTLVDDEVIHQLNKQYRQVDRPTDVLSFPMEDTEFPDVADIVPPLGDIVISVLRAFEQARLYGHTLERELGFLAVHGFLHLVGYDHQTEEEEQKMFSRQKEVLDSLKLTR